MTTISTGNTLAANLSAINNTGRGLDPANSGFATLGHGDFLKLMVAQLQQQDPFEPVDNKDMLAQMAQFSNLAGSTEANATLSTISDKLDALIAAQKAATAASIPTPTPTA